jgi:hypothetical protein
VAARKSKAERQREALAAELRRRNAGKFTAEAIAGRHEHQLRYLSSAEQFAIALCSRRAGKSFANMALLALTALATNNVTCLYLGLTERAVRLDIVRNLWTPMVAAFGLPFTDVDADGVSRCTTAGSIVRFASVDDSSHIEQYRGGDYAGGVVIVDECQSIATDVLRALVENIVIPALSSTTEAHPIPGRLRLSGTIPETPHGGFYDYYTKGEGWEKHSWNRFSNPYLTDQEQQLEKKLKLLGLSRADPRILRDDFGQLVWDASTNAYRYQPGPANTWKPVLHKYDIGPFHCAFADKGQFDRFAVGIDPAQRRDRFAFVVWGWTHTKRSELYHVAECITDPGADPQESEWLEVTKAIKARYGNVRYIKDPGSTASVNDTLYHSHGIVIEVAIKGPGSLKRRVDRLADLLFTGKAKTIEGSQLDDDLQTATWDAAAREKGKWELSKAMRSPDVSDAASYAIPLFQAVAGEALAKPMSEPEHWAAEAKKEIARLWKNAGQKEHRTAKSIVDSLWKGPGQG